MQEKHVPGFLVFFRHYPGAICRYLSHSIHSNATTRCEIICFNFLTSTLSPSHGNWNPLLTTIRFASIRNWLAKYFFLIFRAFFYPNDGDGNWISTFRGCRTCHSNWWIRFVDCSVCSSRNPLQMKLRRFLSGPLSDAWFPFVSFWCVAQLFDDAECQNQKHRIPPKRSVCHCFRHGHAIHYSKRRRGTTPPIKSAWLFTHKFAEQDLFTVYTQ